MKMPARVVTFLPALPIAPNEALMVVEENDLEKSRS